MNNVKPDFLHINTVSYAAGFSKPYTQEAFDKYDSGLYPNEYSNTDWIDEIYKSRAFQTGHNVSARGGSEKTGFLCRMVFWIGMDWL